MATNGVNDFTPKTQADFKPEELKNADTQKVKNTIFDLTNSINYDMENNIMDNGQIDYDKNEDITVRNWIGLIDKTIGNISENVKQELTNFIENLKDLAIELFDALGPKEESYKGQSIEINYDGDYIVLDEVNPNEPTDTDYDPFAYIKAMSDKELQDKVDEFKIPERKFDAMSQFQKQIKEKYYACIEKGYSNGVKASNLKCFQAQYSEQLKNIASTVETDGKFEIKHLYEQLDSQIRFYEELAERDKKSNQPKQNHGLSDRDRAKAANQKMHTREDFINDLIRNGYTIERANKVADENGIV